MHIADGILSVPIAVSTTAVAVAAVGVGLNRSGAELGTPARRVCAVVVASSAMLCLSSIHIPAFAGTSAHASAAPLAGMMLGPWVATVAAGITVFIQAMFGHGGFSAWGADTLAMGLLASFGGWLVLQIGLKRGWPVGRSAAVASFVGNALTYVATALLIGFSVGGDAGGWARALAVGVAYLPAELPIMAGESAATGLLVASVLHHRDALGYSPILNSVMGWNKVA